MVVNNEPGIGYPSDEPEIELEIFEFAIIEDGVITNITPASEPLADNWILCPEGAGIGWIDNGSGEFVKPPEPPAPAPESCTRRQGRLALLQYGLLDDVEAVIDGIPDPLMKRAAQIEYEADTWASDNMLILEVWDAVGGTHSQLDDLFRLAVTL